MIGNLLDLTAEIGVAHLVAAGGVGGWVGGANGAGDQQEEQGKATRHGGTPTILGAGLMVPRRRSSFQ